MSGGFSLIEKIEIAAPIEKVWDAVINPEIIKKYLFGTETISDWKAGSPIIFQGEWNGVAYKDKGTILEIEPLIKLKYDYWSSFSKLEDKPENYQIITFELIDENGITILSLKQENIPTESSKEHSSNNWKAVLNQLKQIVEEK